jgi:type IV secretory pathway component VirB8
MKKPEDYSDREIMERIAMHCARTANAVETIKTIIVVIVVLNVVAGIVIAMQLP